MENVGPAPHQSPVLARRVGALTIGDGTLEQVVELALGTEVVGSDEVHHAPVLDQVVLR